MLLFAYGTLQDRAVQMANFGRELDGRPDSLTGYALLSIVIADANVVALSGKTHHKIAQRKCESCGRSGRHCLYHHRCRTRRRRSI